MFRWDQRLQIIQNVISFVLDIGFVDVPAEVTQEEGHTGFLHLPCAVLALIFSREKDSPAEFWALTILVVFHLLGSFLFLFLFLVRKNPSSCDDTGNRTQVSTSEGFQVPN